MAKTDKNKPLYMISVAADLAGLHPQTLRIYENKGLVKPQRSGGNTRMYSQADVERLELISQLTDEGINLAGVIRILDMRERMEELRAELDEMREQMQQSSDTLHEMQVRATISSLVNKPSHVRMLADGTQVKENYAFLDDADGTDTGGNSGADSVTNEAGAKPSSNEINEGSLDAKQLEVIDTLLSRKKQLVAIRGVFAMRVGARNACGVRHTKYHAKHPTVKRHAKRGNKMKRDKNMK